jgi:hypothetical protein
MTPSEYEMRVGEYFRRLGYAIRHTPASNDYGIDVFATKGTERLAVQAKMYGSSARRVNRDVVMHLHGAKDYFDCNRAVIVTDGIMMDDAAMVARKLGIDVLTLPPDQLPPSPAFSRISDKTVFDAIWEQHVMPLVGLVMRNSQGGSNTLLRVDWAGVERITENDRHQHLPIDIFRKVVAELLSRGEVSRDFINQLFLKRASSGIVLILSQVPIFECVSNPIRLKLRATAHQQLSDWGFPLASQQGDTSPRAKK